MPVTSALDQHPPFIFTNFAVIRLTNLVTPTDRAAAYRADGRWDDETLAGRVRGHAAAQPDAVAVVEGETGAAHTYAQLDADADALAASLAGLGVGTGDVASIQLPNRYEAVVAAVAVQRLGAVINPLLPNYRERELRHVFDVAQPKVVFTPGEHRGFDHRALVAQLRAGTEPSASFPAHVVVGDDPGADGHAYTDLVAEGVTAANGGDFVAPVVDAAAVSELIFTSGTEAKPKGIMHTEQTAGFSVRIAATDLGVTATDVVWMPSPVGHSTGFNYGVRFALHHGLTLVLQDRWDADVAARIVGEHGCTYTLAATTFLQDLVGAAGRAGVTLDSLRLFGCGGAAVPPDLVRAASGVGIQVLRLYGSTECLVVTWVRPGSTDAERSDTDGRAMSHVDVEVRGEDGTATASPGEPGEIYVRGPNTCVGFFDDEERTAATFDADGWVRSGDLGVLDTGVHLAIVGRRKEIIIRGGMNITPREVEELLVGFDEVERAAVIGLPDERLGERMCACVVLRDGASLTLPEVVERLKGVGLATYKLPEQLVCIDALPMTASGKVQKHVLIEQLGPA